MPEPARNHAAIENRLIRVPPGLLQGPAKVEKSMPLGQIAQL